LDARGKKWQEDINRMINSRRMRWVRHVARIGVMRNSYNRSENLRGRVHSKDLGIDERIIVEWILGK
jgi:hypothetical protein